jgi:hypothetical protein
LAQPLPGQINGSVKHKTVTAMMINLPPRLLRRQPYLIIFKLIFRYLLDPKLFVSSEKERNSDDQTYNILLVKGEILPRKEKPFLGV